MTKPARKPRGTAVTPPDLPASQMRYVAQHCAALTASSNSMVQDLQPLDQLVARLCKGVKLGLEAVLQTLADVKHEPLQFVRYDGFLHSVPPFSSNSLFRVQRSDAQFLILLEGQAVMRLIDRYFGGTGQGDANLVSEFPMSADLLIRQLEAIIIARLAEAAGSVEASGFERVRHEANVHHLPFVDEAEMVALTRLVVSEPGHQPWAITLAFSAPALRILGPKLNKRVTSRANGTTGWSDVIHTPMGDVAMPVRAILSECSMPITVIASLAAGQIIPITPARSILLRIGETPFGRGAIGRQDDHVAVRIQETAKH